MGRSVAKEVEEVEEEEDDGGDDDKEQEAALSREIGFGSKSRRLCYYVALGVASDSTTPVIRTAYKRLAMLYMASRWARDRKMEARDKNTFQRIRQAYEVLSDAKKRPLYDMGLYDGTETEDDVESISNFVGELLEKMANASIQDNNCSLDELQGMLQAMYS